jgi:hypothetical protein
MFCHKCGSTIVEGSEFCIKCGTKAVIKETATPPAPSIPSVSLGQELPELTSTPNTNADAYERLRSNLPSCPKIKIIKLNENAGFVMMKGKLCNYTVTVTNGNVGVESSFNFLSVAWIISCIIFIGALGILNYLAYEHDWPAAVPWIIWGVLIIIDYIVMSFIAKPEKEAVITYINKTLKTDLKW